MTALTRASNGLSLATHLEEPFSDEIKRKRIREEANHCDWCLLDRDQRHLKAPPMDVDIEATRFFYFVAKPS
jgi:hypothetical protein